MKKIPFKSAPKFEIKAVGNERTGIVYLKSISAITPKENPVDFQENKKRQNKFLLRLNQRIAQLAKDHGVEVSVMRNRVMNSMAPETDRYAALNTLVSAVNADDEFNTDNIKNSILLLKVENIWWLGIYTDDVNSELFLRDNVKAKSFSDFLNKEFNGFMARGEFQTLSKKAEKTIKSYVAFLDILPKDAEVVDSQEEILDFLDPETAELLFNLNNEDSEAIAKKAATFMLSNRVCYAVTAVDGAVKGSTSLVIDTTSEGIEKDSFIKFDNNYVRVTETYVNGQSPVLKVEDLIVAVEPESVGFIYSHNKDLKVGYEHWTLDDTNQIMSIELINLLHDFYKEEAGLLSKEDSEESEGNSLTISQNPLNLSLSTGPSSLEDSNGLDVQIPDSAREKNLITNQ